MAESTSHFMKKRKENCSGCLAFAGGDHNHGNGFINNSRLNKAHCRLTPWCIHHTAVPTHSILMCPLKNQLLMLRQFGLQPDGVKWLCVLISTAKSSSPVFIICQLLWKVWVLKEGLWTATVITEDFILLHTELAPSALSLLRGETKIGISQVWVK